LRPGRACDINKLLDALADGSAIRQIMLAC
jgi:hypothetical protein